MNQGGKGWWISVTREDEDTTEGDHQGNVFVHVRVELPWLPKGDKASAKTEN